jgi:transcriptional regulator with XRE-family HTH domain
MSATSNMGGSLTVQANGARLKELRKARRLKQCEVEVMAGIPLLRVSQYENGRPISIDHLLALSNFYGVAPQELSMAASRAKLARVATRVCRVLGWQPYIPQQDGEALLLDDE